MLITWHQGDGPHGLALLHVEHDPHLVHGALHGAHVPHREPLTPKRDKFNPKYSKFTPKIIPGVIPGIQGIHQPHYGPNLPQKGRDQPQNGFWHDGKTPLKITEKWNFFLKMRFFHGISMALPENFMEFQGRDSSHENQTPQSGLTSSHNPKEILM